jgi:hypothetical protein
MPGRLAAKSIDQTGFGASGLARSSRLPGMIRGVWVTRQTRLRTHGWPFRASQTQQIQTDPPKSSSHWSARPVSVRADCSAADNAVEDLGDDAPCFLPVESVDRPGSDEPASTSDRVPVQNAIEIDIACGHRLRIIGGHNPEASARFIRGLCA